MNLRASKIALKNLKIGENETYLLILYINVLFKGILFENILEKFYGNKEKMEDSLMM